MASHGHGSFGSTCSVDTGPGGKEIKALKIMTKVTTEDENKIKIQLNIHSMV